ncbi:acyl-CoA carboxylase subunit epsilon [Corynebacterium sp. MSK044]|uniref:acyl-CoA carboxylase subunit epsilon n=1 Tax=unclassified Corynebacterium TaxID=2624378 RepID=UPI00254CCE40|nr:MULTISPECIES: acyl-CoA carboxylase subunit epsilon [unclassified Corynebacterium]MDK8795264.1 acyl-CoA carboxylase subunit epsilon [Corynebacterium sp. MSK041]MDK8797966.1 acyl-CoA carboxylase subunit epsilon [Corynebacterium sp. MSK044]
MTNPLFTVVKGNPTEEELAALTQVLTDLQQEAKSRTGGGHRNLWGRPAPRNHDPVVFNPSAFNSQTLF